jgi:hypothetical protein
MSLPKQGGTTPIVPTSPLSPGFKTMGPMQPMTHLMMGGGRQFNPMGQPMQQPMGVNNMNMQQPPNMGMQRPMQMQPMQPQVQQQPMQPNQGAQMLNDPQVMAMMRMRGMGMGGY